MGEFQDANRSQDQEMRDTHPITRSGGEGHAHRSVANRSCSRPLTLARLRHRHEPFGVHDTPPYLRRSHQHRLASGGIDIGVHHADEAPRPQSRRIDDEADTADFREVVRLIERREAAADQRDARLAEEGAEVGGVPRRMEDVRGEGAAVSLRARDAVTGSVEEAVLRVSAGRTQWVEPSTRRRRAARGARAEGAREGER